VAIIAASDTSELIVLAAFTVRPRQHTGGPFHDRKRPLTWEPPIGIEPMTYALRGVLSPSSAVRRVTPPLLTRLLVPRTSKVIQGCC
jgi:hypothetical protein